MVNFLTQVPDCECRSPVISDFFLSFETSICSTMALPPLGNSDHFVVSASIDFPENSKRDASFRFIVYGYSHAA